MHKAVPYASEEQRRKARPNLYIRDLVLYGIVGALGLDTLGAASSYGGQALFWVLLVGFTFFVPYQFLMAYLLIFPDLLLLRYKRPDVRRPYRIPGGLVGAWIVTLLSMFYTVIVSYFLLFPTGDVIRSAGVSRITYETTQLVVLGIIFLLAALFYLWGRKERRLHEHVPQEAIRDESEQTTHAR